MENSVEFYGIKCKVVLEEYALYNRAAIRLVDEEDGSPVATATTNSYDIPLEDREVLIKDYAENRGIYDLLVDAGYIERDFEPIQRGFVVFKKTRLLK